MCVVCRWYKALTDVEIRRAGKREKIIIRTTACGAHTALHHIPTHTDTSTPETKASWDHNVPVLEDIPLKAVGRLSVCLHASESAIYQRLWIKFICGLYRQKNVRNHSDGVWPLEMRREHSDVTQSLWYKPAPELYIIIVTHIWLRKTHYSASLFWHQERFGEMKSSREISYYHFTICKQKLLQIFVLNLGKDKIACTIQCRQNVKNTYHWTERRSSHIYSSCISI